MMKDIKLLVRNKVPEEWTNRGIASNSRILVDDDEFLNTIKRQICAICNTPGFSLDSVCDLYDLLYHVTTTCGYTSDMINYTRGTIYKQFGDYSRRIYVDSIEEKECDTNQ